MIADESTASNVTGFCPGDSCKWRNYKTLAVCSSFEDISSNLYSENLNGTDHKEMYVEGLDPAPFVNRFLSSFWTTTSNAFMVAKNDGEANNRPEHLHETKITDIYVAYFSACSYRSGSGPWSTAREDPKRWKAYKASLHYCLQTLNSTGSNSSTTTTTVNTNTDLTWKDSRSDNTTYCHTEDGEDFCVNNTVLIRNQLDQMFNGIGSYWIGGDDYYSGLWTLFLTSDILGQELSICDTSPNLGLAGFQRRINNIAVSITNESVPTYLQ